MIKDSGLVQGGSKRFRLLWSFLLRLGPVLCYVSGTVESFICRVPAQFTLNAMCSWHFKRELCYAGPSSFSTFNLDTSMEDSKPQPHPRTLKRKAQKPYYTT